MQPSNDIFNDDQDDSDSTDSSPPPATAKNGSTLRVLARGNACLCCRRRKLKCDGAKPHCGPCTRGRRANDCHYEQIKVKTKTQVLQSRIRELEAKVKNMEQRRSTDASSSRGSNSPPPRTNSADSNRRLSEPQMDITPTLPLPPTQPQFDPYPLIEPTISSSWHSQSSVHFPLDDPSILLDDPSSTLFNLQSDFWSTDQFSTGTIANMPQNSLTNAQTPWLDLLPDLSGTPSGFTANPLSSGTLPQPVRTISAPAALPPSTLVQSRPLVQPQDFAVSSAAFKGNARNAKKSWDEDVQKSALERTLSSQLEADDVPSHISDQLLRIFAEHRHQCLFEVHMERFCQSLSFPAPQRPHPALMNAIYLLACHFSPNSPFSQYENLFLARTRKGINHSLENADRLLNFLQASCLLAWYFFFKGRLLEGHYHASAAARFAMSCGLHLLKVKADGVTGTLTFYTPQVKPNEKSIIGEPEDPVALAERINLFWSIFLADRTGAIGTGLPVVLPDQDIETPWPRDFGQFGVSDLSHFDTGTLRSLYLPGNPGAPVGPSDNLHAIKAKALALNERASRLASQLEADPQTVRQDGFWETFDSIDSAILCFQESLPPIDMDKLARGHGFPGSSRPSSPSAYSGLYAQEQSFVEEDGQLKSTVCPSLVLAHTAAHGAVIQLHRMFSQNDAGSYRRCLDAARGAMEIVHQVGDFDPRLMPMMLGIVWTSVAETLAVEHERLQRLNEQEQVKAVESELKALFLIMKRLRVVFPILTLRINKVPIFQGCPLSLDPPPLAALKVGDQHICAQHPAAVAAA